MGTEVSEIAWLNALLDGGPLPESEADAPSGLVKLARLQRAFAELQWAELDAPIPATPSPAVRVTTCAQFQWDRLTVSDPLGAGGFGEVFRAVDPMLQREVALKLRRSTDAFAPTSGRAFIDEARRLAQVRHPNVLAVHGAAVDQGRAGIWTDLIDGETLAARLEREGALTAPSLLQLLTSLAEALSAVHAQAIVHGDLKPANVMCEAGTGRVVLMDFGAGARLDDSGRAVLLSGSRNFMAPEQSDGRPLGTAADIYSLGATLFYAATRSTLEHPAALARMEQRKDLPRAFRQLLRSLLNTDPAARPEATAVVAQCHFLQAEPERATRRRLRLGLIVVLVGAVIASSVALWFTQRARTLAVTERNRAVAARDFLLSIMRSPNPYQTAQPTRSLDVLFDQAVAALPTAFRDDPQTEAQLLQQFGRSLIILDRDLPATQALLRADRLLAKIGAPTSDPARIEIRSFLSDVYRKRRKFPSAIALTEEQAALCTGPTPLPPRSCIAIINDQIEAVGFGGDPLRALQLIDQNRMRARSAALDADYEAVFIVYLQGVMQRELGRTSDALRSFVELTERTLDTAPASHPGLLTDVMWLAWSADDLGEVPLARQLNAYALNGRQELYGSTSRYTVEVRLQAAILALHAGDVETAKSSAQALLAELPKTSSFAGYFDQALLLTALAGDGQISSTRLHGIELAGLEALGAAAPRLTELRLGLAAIALQRQQAELASALLERARTMVEQGNGSRLRPWFWYLQGQLLELQSNATPAEAARLYAQASELLAAQQRRLFDPVGRRWIGVVPGNAVTDAERIRRLAERVRIRRAAIQAP